MLVKTALSKIVPKSCVLKLFPKNINQNCRFVIQNYSYFPKLLPKSAPQNYSPKSIPKIITEICSGQLLHQSTKTIPKNSSMLLQTRKIAPHNCFPKLLFKVVTESRVLKKFPHKSCCPKAGDSANLFTKTAPKSHSAKRLVVTESCSPKLPLKLPPKAAPQNCCSSNQFIGKFVPEN